MGKIWKGQWTIGDPAGRYENGRTWKGQRTIGNPIGRYEGADGGAAAAALILGNI